MFGKPFILAKISEGLNNQLWYRKGANTDRKNRENMAYHLAGEETHTLVEAFRGYRTLWGCVKGRNSNEEW